MSQRLGATFEALKHDLIHEGGPRISTMRNYRFCIAVYPPAQEFALRRHVQRLTVELTHAGWVVKSISLQTVLLDRLRAKGEPYIASLIDREKSASVQSPARGLNLLTSKITAEIEGPEGIAADVAREIQAFTEANPDKAEPGPRRRAVPVFPQLGAAQAPRRSHRQRAGRVAVPR
jgi:hypothetical protein